MSTWASSRWCDSRKRPLDRSDHVDQRERKEQSSDGGSDGVLIDRGSGRDRRRGLVGDRLSPSRQSGPSYVLRFHFCLLRGVTDSIPNQGIGGLLRSFALQLPDGLGLTPGRLALARRRAAVRLGRRPRSPIPGASSACRVAAKATLRTGVASKLGHGQADGTTLPKRAWAAQAEDAGQLPSVRASITIQA